MGFLDRKDRIVDIVLTAEGKRQLASGELEFAFFSLHDDGIDYDPWIASSGSYDEARLEIRRIELIESTPVLEASVVPIDRKINKRAAGQPTSFLYQAADRFSRLPAALVLPSSSLEAAATQLSSGSTYYRHSKTVARVALDHVGDTEPGTSKRFLVEVIESGSDGLARLPRRADLSNRPSYGAFVVVVADPAERK